MISTSEADVVSFVRVSTTTATDSTPLLPLPPLLPLLPLLLLLLLLLLLTACQVATCGPVCTMSSLPYATRIAAR